MPHISVFHPHFALHNYLKLNNSALDAHLLVKQLSMAPGCLTLLKRPKEKRTNICMPSMC